MSRNLRLIFAVTTMLGAVAVAPIASAKPPQSQPKPAPKVNWAQNAIAAKKNAVPKVNWAQNAIAAKKNAVPKVAIKVPPVFLPPSKLQQPVFVHHIPVFIPAHSPFIVRGGGDRPYASSYPVSYASAASQSAPAPAPTYQALGLAWNHDGAWVVEPAATLDEASANALTKCNDQYGSCEVSAQSVSEQTFACLAVARGADDTHRLFAARAGSQDAMQAGVVRSMSDAGTSGSIEYAACNTGS